MDRSFTEGKLSVFIKFCIETQTNLLPYCCRENFNAWMTIARCIRVVKECNITPEHYWHGNYDEFTQLLIMLADGYPSPLELLNLAKKETTGEIVNIAQYYYQYMVAMFEYVLTHHGYVVLKPTVYMQNLYPNSKGMLYVYTTDKWKYKERSEIDKSVLVFPADDMESFQQLLKKRIGII